MSAVCVAVAFNDRYIQTVEQLVDAGLPVQPEDLAWGWNMCLCCVDLERILHQADLDWGFDDIGDYVVRARRGNRTPETSF